MLGRTTVAILCAPLGMYASSASAACDARTPVPPKGAALTARALVEINEMGLPDGAVSSTAPPWSVDPTGRRAAVLVTRADLASDGFCHSLVVIDLTSATARVVAAGGDFAPDRAPMRGLFANWGTQLVTTPVWSPDGRWIAWMRRENGRTQAWIAAADGSGARVATSSQTDVEQVGWSPFGNLIYATRPAEPAVRAALDLEGQSGWLYDDRFTPNASARPLVASASIPLTWFVADGAETKAIPEPIAAAAPSRSGARLSIVRVDTLPRASSRLTVTRADGSKRSCASEACEGRLVDAWWQPGTETAWFLRREGWKFETSAVYRVTAGGVPERVLATTDAVNFCQPGALGLVCLREGSATPRTMVQIGWANGQLTTVFDPNPGFARYRLGNVTRLRWKNDRGLEAWGDLVLPP